MREARLWPPLYVSTSVCLCVCVEEGYGIPTPWIRTHPPVDRKNDTCLWKHYVPSITVAGGRIINHLSRFRFQQNVHYKMFQQNVPLTTSYLIHENKLVISGTRCDQPDNFIRYSWVFVVSELVIEPVRLSRSTFPSPFLKIRRLIVTVVFRYLCVFDHKGTLLIVCRKS